MECRAAEVTAVRVDKLYFQLYVLYKLKVNNYPKDDQTGWRYEFSIHVPSRSWSSQTNDLTIYTCHFLHKHLALLG